MDILKYLRNKDLQITNEDFDLDTLQKDIRKGYVPNADVNTQIEEAKKGWDPKTTTDYTDLEAKYNTAIKDLSTANDTIRAKSLEVIMLNKGFKQGSFDEVSKLRSSLYADEQDDAKAIASIAERFKDTYFKEPEGTQKIEVPDEPQINGSGTKSPTIEVNRKTKINDLFIKK